MNKKEIQKQINYLENTKKRIDKTISFLKGERKDAPEAKKDPEQTMANEIIHFFKPLNTSYNLLFARKNQREAAVRLLNKHGMEKLQAEIRFLAKIQVMKQQGKKKAEFCPSVKSPAELEEKWSKYEDFKLSLRANKKPHFMGNLMSDDLKWVFVEGDRKAFNMQFKDKITYE